MENKKFGLFDKIKRIKGLEYIIVGIIALLIVAILLGDNIFSKKESAEGDGGYVSGLEDRVENALSKVKGAGKVSVVITVSGGNRTVIATDVKTVKNGTTVETTETPVLVGGKVVVLAEMYPEITGVLIVATGADNLSVRMSITEAAATLLNVEASKIQILTGK